MHSFYFEVIKVHMAYVLADAAMKIDLMILLMKIVSRCFFFLMTSNGKKSDFLFFVFSFFRKPW